MLRSWDSRHHQRRQEHRVQGNQLQHPSGREARHWKNFSRDPAEDTGHPGGAGTGQVRVGEKNQMMEFKII